MTRSEQRVIITRTSQNGPKRRTVYERDVVADAGAEYAYWEIEEIRDGGSWREVGRQHVSEPAVTIEAAAPGAARPPADD